MSICYNYYVGREISCLIYIPFPVMYNGNEAIP